MFWWYPYTVIVDGDHKLTYRASNRFQCKSDTDVGPTVLIGIRNQAYNNRFQYYLRQYDSLDIEICRAFNLKIVFNDELSSFGILRAINCER